MLNLGDIVKFIHANSYFIGEVTAIYRLEKSNVKIEGDEEYKYCVDTFGTIKTFIISEKEVEKRYVEIVNCKFINPLEDVEQPIQEGLQYEFDAESLKGIIKEEEIPTIRLMEVFRLFKEKVSLELVTKYGDEYEIEDIDEYDFDTPFYVRIDNDLRVYHHDDIYTDERESVDYDDIEYLIYDGKKYKITQEITKREFNILCNKNVCIKLNGTSYSYNVLGIINDEIHLISEATTFYLKSTKVEVCFKEVKIID